MQAREKTVPVRTERSACAKSSGYERICCARQQCSWWGGRGGSGGGGGGEREAGPDPEALYMVLEFLSLS